MILAPRNPLKLRKLRGVVVGLPVVGALLLLSSSIKAQFDPLLVRINYQPSRIEENMSPRERRAFFEEGKADRRLSFEEKPSYKEPREISIDREIRLSDFEHIFPKVVQQCGEDIENATAECKVLLGQSLIALSLAQVIESQIDGFHWKPRVSDARLEFSLIQFLEKRQRALGLQSHVASLDHAFSRIVHDLKDNEEVRIEWGYRAGRRVNNLADEFGAKAFGSRGSYSIIRWQKAPVSFWELQGIFLEQLNRDYMVMVVREMVHAMGMIQYKDYRKAFYQPDVHMDDIRAYYDENREAEFTQVEDRVAVAYVDIELPEHASGLENFKSYLDNIYPDVYETYLRRLRDLYDSEGKQAAVRYLNGGLRTDALAELYENLSVHLGIEGEPMLETVEIEGSRSQIDSQLSSEVSPAATRLLTAFLHSQEQGSAPIFSIDYSFLEKNKVRVLTVVERTTLREVTQSLYDSQLAIKDRLEAERAVERRVVFLASFCVNNLWMGNEDADWTYVAQRAEELVPYIYGGAASDQLLSKVADVLNRFQMEAEVEELQLQLSASDRVRTSTGIQVRYGRAQSLPLPPSLEEGLVSFREFLPHDISIEVLTSSDFGDQEVAAEWRRLATSMWAAERSDTFKNSTASRRQDFMQWALHQNLRAGRVSLLNRLSTQYQF